MSHDDSHCSRCAGFITFMMKLKHVEKRLFLFEASKQSMLQARPYDTLYHTYAHYLLVCTKIQYEIFSQSRTPKALFRSYQESVGKLKQLMYSEFDDDRYHLETELAFCHFK